MGTTFQVRPLAAAALAAALAVAAHAAELAVLTDGNWDELAPHGKEADAILGDYVLRNDRIVVVVGNPQLIGGRSCSRSPHYYQAGIIDLTLRDAPNDQLTLYRLGPSVSSTHSDLLLGTARYRPDYAADFEPQRGPEVVLTLRPKPHYSHYCPSEIRYRLRDGEPWVRIEVAAFNPGQAPPKDDPFWIRQAKAKVAAEIKAAVAKEEDEFGLGLGPAPDDGAKLGISLTPEELHTPGPAFVCTAPGGDTFRAEGAFEKGEALGRRFRWAYDRRDGQAYGVWIPGTNDTVKLKAGDEHLFTATVFPGRDALEVMAVAQDLAGTPQAAAAVVVRAGAEPLAGADVRLLTPDGLYAAGRTGADGRLAFRAPAGPYRIEAAPFGLAPLTQDVAVAEGAAVTFDFPAPGRVRAAVTGEDGAGIPCKVEFRGTDGTPDPDFGPDDGPDRVRNLVYSPDGAFTQVLPPGRYRAIVTRGPEYDAVAADLEVAPGAEAPLAASLRRTVRTDGWISADFHTHTTASGVSSEGASTADPRGRVLNLAAEQIEFAPATEHDRIASYEPVIAGLGLGGRLASCPGTGLTDGGRKYAFNHQNAFPLVHHPRWLDGGAPQRPQHCSQIDWLRSWGAPIDPENPWLTARQPGYEKLIIVTQPDNRLAGAHQRNYWLVSSMFRSRDLATYWDDDRAHIKPFFTDSDGDGAPDRITHEFAASCDAWDVRTLEPLLDPKAHVANDVLDWLASTRSGYRMPPVVGSTAYGSFHGCGRFRTYVRSATDDPAQLDPLAVARAVKAGRVMLTTGPFLELEVRTDQTAGSPAGPGDSLAARKLVAAVRVRVQGPDWIRIDRVQLLVNGEAVDRFDWSRASHPALFAGGPVQFDHEDALPLAGDAHVIAVARGSGPDYRGRRKAGDDTLGHAAVTAPVYIDAGGDGFTPQSPVLDAVETSMRLAVPVRSAADAPPGRIEIRIRNRGELAASDVVRVALLPPGVIEPLVEPAFPFSLPPGAVTNVALAVKLVDSARLKAALGDSVSAAAWVRRSGKAPGLAPSRLQIVADGTPEALLRNESDEDVGEFWRD